MGQQKFRHPEEMQSRKERMPLSTRVMTSTFEVLSEAATLSELSLAELVANILDDYASWLKSEGSKRKR